MRYSSINTGMEESLEQNPERCAASRFKGILNARLGRIMAFLQVCQQHLAAESMFRLRSGGRVLVASRDCPRQRLHCDFKNAPWSEENGEQWDDTETQSEAAG